VCVCVLQYPARTRLSKAVVAKEVPNEGGWRGKRKGSTYSGKKKKKKLSDDIDKVGADEQESVDHYGSDEDEQDNDDHDNNEQEVDDIDETEELPIALICDASDENGDDYVDNDNSGDNSNEIEYNEGSDKSIDKDDDDVGGSDDNGDKDGDCCKGDRDIDFSQLEYTAGFDQLTALQQQAFFFRSKHNMTFDQEEEELFYTMDDSQQCNFIESRTKQRKEAEAALANTKKKQKKKKKKKKKKMISIKWKREVCGGDLEKMNLIDEMISPIIDEYFSENEEDWKSLEKWRIVSEENTQVTVNEEGEFQFEYTNSDGEKKPSFLYKVSNVDRDSGGLTYLDVVDAADLHNSEAGRVEFKNKKIVPGQLRRSGGGLRDVAAMDDSSRIARMRLKDGGIGDYKTNNAIYASLNGSPCSYI
jgi:hypothetical protein